MATNLEQELGEIRENKFGLRTNNETNSSGDDKRRDLESTLALANYLRFISGKNVDIEIDKDNIADSISRYLDELDYLNTTIGRMDIRERILETLNMSLENNKVVQLPASNALLVIFRFYDALLISLPQFNQEVNIPSSWTKTGASLKPKEIDEIKQRLYDLEDNIVLCLREAFERFVMPIDKYLARYDSHKFWQSSLTQKQEIINRVNSKD